MKKLQRLMAGFAIVSLLLGVTYRVYATCANTDVMCFVVGGTQVYRVDSSGNETLTGGLSVTGTGTFTGAVTNSSNVTTVGKTIYTPTFGSAQISTTTTLTPTSTYLLVVSTGANVVCGTGLLGTAAAPCISTATATNGQYLLIASTSTAGTVTFTDGASNAMALGAARTVDVDNTLGLIYDSTSSTWKEVSFGSN